MTKESEYDIGLLAKTLLCLSHSDHIAGLGKVGKIICRYIACKQKCITMLGLCISGVSDV